MGQSITVTRAYGWVIDKFDGDYAANLAQFIPPSPELDLLEWVEKRMKENSLDVEVDSFGYDFQSQALVHRASAVNTYDWYHDAALLQPDVKAEAAYKRELLQALDALEWDEAGLGDPSWLVLITYG